MTSEHIWGNWTKQFVHRSTNKHYSAQVFVPSPGKPNPPNVRIRAGDPLDANASIVCPSCNSTWLSAIQNQAKQYLIQLFNGNVCTVDQTAQAAISAWIAMATMTGEFSTKGAGIGVSQRDREWLMRTMTPPANWRIWIGRHPVVSPEEQWIHVAFPIVNADKLPAAMNEIDRTPNSQTTAFTIGELFFFSMSTPFPEITHGWDWRTARRARSRLVQVWPYKFGQIFWPPPMMTDLDARSFGKAIMIYFDDLALRRGFG